MESRHSLEKLSLSECTLHLNVVESICQNGKTLRVLDLSDSYGVHPKYIHDILKNCSELREVNFGFSYHWELKEDAVDFIVNNITINIEKLAFGNNRYVQDKQVKNLVTRCNKITALNLYRTGITKDSITYIIENLKSTLEELDVRSCWDATKGNIH